MQKQLSSLRVAAALLFMVILVSAHAAPRHRAHTPLEWNPRGVNPYKGNIAAAVDDYKFIPSNERALLKQRIRDLDYDEVVTIRRDSIDGMKYVYAPELYGMHSGSNGTNDITRNTWTDEDIEFAFSYCLSTICLYVPFTCDNVAYGYKRPGPPVFPPAAPLVPYVPEQELLPPVSALPPLLPPLALLPPMYEEAPPVCDCFYWPPGGGDIPGWGWGAPPTVIGPPTVIFVPVAPPALPPETPPATVSSIPEPSSWALMVLGVSLLSLRKKIWHQNSKKSMSKSTTRLLS